MQRKESSYPTGRNDGTQVYFDTGTGTADTGLSPETTYYYRACSYVQGSEQWADECAQDLATTLPQVAEVTVSVDAPADVSEGSHFAVNVDISEVENLDACDYYVSYDPDVLEVTDGMLNGTMLLVDRWGLVPPGALNAQRASHRQSVVDWTPKIKT
jgi:hypothetical protein